jgi:hypothetical protein
MLLWFLAARYLIPYSRLRLEKQTREPSDLSFHLHATLSNAHPPRSQKINQVKYANFLTNFAH